MARPPEGMLGAGSTRPTSDDPRLPPPQGSSPLLRGCPMTQQQELAARFVEAGIRSGYTDFLSTREDSVRIARSVWVHSCLEMADQILKEGA